MKELISTDDLNLELLKSKIPARLKWWESYRNSLLNKTPLSLGQFIACDLDGEIVPEIKYCGYKDGDKYWIEHEKILKEAEKRLVFDGFKIKYKYILKGDKSTFWVVYKDLKVCYYENNKCTFAGKYKTFQDLIKFNLTLK